MRAVRFALYAGVAVSLGCASGAPQRAVSDGGQTTFATPAPGGKGGSGGSGGSGSSGTGGSGGSKYMEPPLKWPDASAVVDAGPMDAAIDAGPPTYTCDDGKKNGKETSADCGGADCDPCDDGKSCVSATDCKSGFCGPSSTCTVESCEDKAKNQDETDVDCGGATCETKCALGKKCAMPEDCTTMNCDDAGVCACTPLTMCEENECGNKPDGCGGMLMCPGCPTGQQCHRDRTCGPCDADECRNNCGILEPVRCCRSDGRCGCQGLIGGCN